MRAMILILAVGLIGCGGRFFFPEEAVWVGTGPVPYRNEFYRQDVICKGRASVQHQTADIGSYAITDEDAYAGCMAEFGWVWPEDY